MDTNITMRLLNKETVEVSKPIPQTTEVKKYDRDFLLQQQKQIVADILMRQAELAEVEKILAVFK